jgi:hypothetical protein
MEWVTADLGNPPAAPLQLDMLQVTLPPGVYSVSVGEHGIKGIQKIGDDDQVVLIFDVPISPD